MHFSINSRYSVILTTLEDLFPGVKSERAVTDNYKVILCFFVFAFTQKENS